MQEDSGSPSAPETSTPTPPTPSGIRFSWPPPGLESLQGILWQATGNLGLGALVLVLPLLWSVGRAVPFYSLGPFGDAWWILIFTSFFGLLILLVGFENLFRFFRQGWKATREGVPVRKVFEVASDRSRDMGFLLQGARAYQALEPAKRQKVARARVSVAVLYLVGALWASVGFFLAVLLAARGVLEPSGIWLMTLGPVGALLILGVVTRGREGTLLRKPLKGLSRDPWKDEEVRATVGRWVATLRTADPEGVGGGGGGRGGGLLAGAVSVVVLAFLIALPTFTLTLTNTVGPLLALVAVPNFSRTQQKAANVEVFRRYRLPPDPSITPLEAGEAMVRLSSAGGWRGVELLKEPTLVYEDEFLGGGPDNPLGRPSQEWPEHLFELVRQGLNPEQRAFLAQVASHPAFAEFGILARASAADFLEARYELPFPEGTSAVEIPIPKLSTLRLGAYAMVARAAEEFLTGDETAAEETLKEIISTGFLLTDEGPTLIDNLIGVVVAGLGGTALENFYRAAGRTEDAEELRWARDVTERAGELSTAALGRQDVASSIRQVPATITSPDAIRGLKWELFMMMNGLGPCLNAHKVVFGPGEDMQTFLQDAHEVLVRYPSEEQVFDLMRTGWFGAVDGDSRGRWVGRLVGLTMGGTGTPGSCAELVSTISW